MGYNVYYNYNGEEKEDYDYGDCLIGAFYSRRCILLTLLVIVVPASIITATTTDVG